MTQEFCLEAGEIILIVNVPQSHNDGVLPQPWSGAKSPWNANRKRWRD